jgi:hypothetical protein
MSLPELTTTFIISQVAYFFAMGFDFLSLQYKKREHTFLCLIAAASLISFHYFLLGKIPVAVIMLISVMRFITSYLTTNKKYIYVFIILNTISLFFTYKEPYDLIIYTGITIFIISNFQENNKLMRQMMMVGSLFIISYNIVINTPMGIIAECSFLLSNFIGYYRHYIKPNYKLQNKNL